MASASSLLSEEQFLCSICLDVFTEPVSTPCGHNFCKACITMHWASSAQSQCPLCNERFHRRPKLRVNTGFREVVENFKKIKIIDRDESPAKPGEVPCDVCPGTKLKALKSCLVCLTSYCESHLEPHQRVAALKRHKLIDPVENLEDRMCKKHDKLLELFCRSDQICVCVMCTEHKTHDTVPLEEEYEERKAQLGKNRAEVQQTIQERLQKVREIQSSVELNKVGTENEIAESVETVTALIASIQNKQAELIEVIEEKQRAAEKQAEGFITELEQEITELRRRSTELERLSHTEDHLLRLQSLLSLSTYQQTKDWSDIGVHTHQCVGTVRRAVAQLEETLIQGMEKVMTDLKLVDGKINTQVTTNKKQTASDTLKRQTETVKDDLENTPEDVKLKMIQQLYAVDVILDPDTANPWLLFSEDMKQVQTTFIWWHRYYSPKRFDRCLYVLGDRGFSSGRFYYEVQVKGKTGWDLGVVRKSVDRKSKFALKPKNGIWTISLRKENKYKALHDRRVPLSPREKPRRIGVFVDYEEGLVSFYDAEAEALIYSFTDCNFREKIYPFFSPGFFEGGKNSAPLIINSVTNTSNTWQEICKYILLVFLGVILLFSKRDELLS
ncbi:E3 ubiquitin-protein ligase TRIM21-like [Polymixia lowei]